MCGIAGFCNFQEDFLKERERWSQVLVLMRESIAHRGHDQTGEYLSSSVGFAHTRLSIRDIIGGTQPMLRRKNGDLYGIIYNGEVYNADELTQELKRLGYIFETTCDTEVLLNAYIAYGADFVTKLNGIFAFAIWDGRRQELLLFRDHAGVKPLFYTKQNDTLIFASEIKALFCHPAVRPEADENSFREIFGIGPARTPGCGVFRGISEVRPGCKVVFSASGMREEAYWELKARPHTENYTETVAHVSYLIRDAVERQMVSDVPVCSFLSGGVDSSVVTALASKYLQGQGARLNTFSFDFTGNDKYFKSNAFQPTRDQPFVDQMLELYPLNHTSLKCTERHLVERLPAAVFAKDLPGMTDVDASLLHFCGLVAQKNKVALTGECADEIFGGYPWFYRPDLLATDGFPWSNDFYARTALLRADIVKSLDIEGYAYDRYQESLRQTPLLPGEGEEKQRRREISWLNMRWFMQTLLSRMDFTSMASGLEARVPFADCRIIEYLYNVPWEMKYRPGLEKALLRDACQDLLPPEILYRKKSPYPKTYDPSYERILAQQLHEVLLDGSAPINRFLNSQKAERFLSAPKDYGRPWFGQLMAGPQMIAYLLQVNTWMLHYGVG